MKVSLYMEAGDTHWPLPHIQGMFPYHPSHTNRVAAGTTQPGRGNSAQVPLGRKASTPHLKLPGPALSFPTCLCPSIPSAKPMLKAFWGTVSYQASESSWGQGTSHSPQPAQPRECLLTNTPTYTDALFKDFCALPFKHHP